MTQYYQPPIYQPPPPPRSSFMAGCGGTMGVITALVIVFVVIPIVLILLSCAGCISLGIYGASQAPPATQPNAPIRSDATTRPSIASASKPAARSMAVAVEFINSKVVEGKHRYFFRVRNRDASPLSGSVWIGIYRAGASSPTYSEDFNTKAPMVPDGGTVVYFDASTGPTADYGDYRITRFQYRVTVDQATVASGSGFIP